MEHIFPPKVSEHKLTLRDGTKLSLFVSPSETYGHALARTGIKDSNVASIVIENMPIWYEPDSASATR